MINIYLITCLVSGKVYVGQTINDLKTRFRQHCGKNTGCVHLSNAITP